MASRHRPITGMRFVSFIFIKDFCFLLLTFFAVCRKLRIMANSHFKTYTSKEIEALFRAALELDKALIPPLALLAFAGLRLSEASRLKHADLDFELRHIRVENPRDCTVRVIEGIPDAVWLWLDLYRKNLTFRGDALAFRLSRIFKAAKLQGHARYLRKAFAAHLFFIMPQRSGLPAIMGCQSVDMRHFELGAASSECDAQAYFSVTPSRIMRSVQI